MKKFLFIIWQCLWGFFQTLAGAAVCLVLLKKEHKMYHGAVLTYWNLETSLSLGLFIFVTGNRPESERRSIEVHEYGHCIQSLILGPLYLPVIVLPSALWCRVGTFRKMRLKKNMSYYDMPIEKSASNLGERITGDAAAR